MLQCWNAQVPRVLVARALSPLHGVLECRMQTSQTLATDEGLRVQKLRAQASRSWILAASPKVLDFEKLP